MLEKVSKEKLWFDNLMQLLNEGQTAKQSGQIRSFDQFIKYFKEGKEISAMN